MAPHEQEMQPGEETQIRETPRPGARQIGSQSGGSSDPRALTPDNLFNPGSVHPCSIVGRARTTQGGIGRKSAGPGQLTKIEDLPPRKPCARVLRSANPQKDNSNMTARPTGRISQPDSYHSAPNRSATTPATYSIATSHSDATACAAPPAQGLPRDSVRGQNPKGRSVPDRTACAASSAQVLGVSASASCGAPTHKKDNSKWLRKLRS